MTGRNQGITEIKPLHLSEANLTASIETFLRQSKVIQESEDLIELDFGPLMKWDTNNPNIISCKATIKKVKES